MTTRKTTTRTTTTPPTIERRQAHRNRSYLGARIALDAQSSSTECLVRNLTDSGAKLILSEAVPLPDAFDLTIERRALAVRARMVWRRGEALGVAFDAPAAAAPAVVLSFDHARRLRECERERDALRARLAALTSLDG